MPKDVKVKEAPVTLREILYPPENTHKDGRWIDSDEAQWQWRFDHGRWRRCWQVPSSDLFLSEE